MYQVQLDDTLNEFRTDLIEAADLPGANDLGEESIVIASRCGHAHDDHAVKRLDVEKSDTPSRDILTRAEIGLVVFGDLNRSGERMAIFLSQFMPDRRQGIQHALDSRGDREEG